MFINAFRTLKDIKTQTQYQKKKMTLKHVSVSSKFKQNQTFTELLLQTVGTLNKRRPPIDAALGSQKKNAAAFDRVNTVIHKTYGR